MKIGILGGGQLGRMFLQEAANYPYYIKVLDPQPDAPCAHLCDEFVTGDFNDADTVFHFGKDCCAVGIEIEHVSVEGLRRLQAAGVRVIPVPDTLAMIQDKGLQKQFYADHDIPTAPFYLAAGKAEINTDNLPFVQKTRTGGYDGKGVQVIESEEELHKLWDVPSVIEELCPIAKEAAVILVKGKNGETAAYPPVEMVFDPVLNLVDIVQMPAVISEQAQANINAVCEKLSEALGGEGIFAIEMFILQDDSVWVNETACRVHNSGHLTIEACHSSQFDQMWRLLAGQPLGSTAPRSAAAMLNLIGAEGAQGTAEIQDLRALLKQPQTHLHWYGKNQVRPGRKMGHITVTAETLSALEHAVQSLKQTVNLTVGAAND